FGLRGEFRERGRISVSDGNQSVPDEQRKVVVVRVLRAGEQRRSEVSTLRYWQTLQRRSQSETDQTRCVCLRDADQFLQHGSRGHEALFYFGFRPALREDFAFSNGPLTHHGVERPVVGEKANGPGADVFIRVTKLCAEKCFIQRSDGVERPESAQLHHDVASFLKQLA